MFDLNFSFYLEKQKKEGFFYVLVENNFFLCLEIYSGINEFEGYKIIDDLKDIIKTKTFRNKYLINSLFEFDNFIFNFIKKNNLSSNFSLSSGYLKENILYVKTINKGQIYIKKNNNFGCLIKDDNIASGIISNGDFFIFTSSNFLNLIGGEDKIKQELEICNYNPQKITEKISLFLKNKNNNASACLFIEFFNKKIISKKEENIKETENKKNLFFNDIKNSRKKLTIFTAIFIFFILVWSTFTGINRKNKLLIDKRINQSKEIILQKLQMAEEVSFLNNQRALILIEESKNELESIKKESEKLNIKNKKIEEIDKIIKETENEIFKTRKTSFQEFFDLSLDNKDALGEKIYLNSNIVYIFDKKKNLIYKFFLEKKSLEKIDLKETKSISLIFSNDEKIFFYIKNLGIYQINNLEKPIKIIENDKDWGEIIDVFVYNNNLYLLDKEKDEIWKYIKTSDSFSQKISYFNKGESIDLSEINSFSIDGSIYLSSKKNIYKYISGKRESFNFNLPLSDFNFNKIFTNKDLEKIYLLDKLRGAVYILSKTGDYIEQVSSEIFSKADDFFVYKEKIYVLIKNKIYKID
ncbi:MAG: hypothetical protein N2593_02710 [Patescibacteria group bacterium]|nr:hypothetical protein [Patescibacteria group bacterium]